MDTEQKIAALKDIVLAARRNGTVGTIRYGMHALYADAIRATSGPIDAESVDRVYQWAVDAREIPADSRG